MILNHDQENALYGRRNVYSDEKYRWPKGVVPYVIDESIPTNRRKFLTQAMNKIQRSVPCVTFKERTNENGYVHIKGTAADCSSEVGYQGKMQVLNLVISAVIKVPGTVIHELLHTLGMVHQHSTYNRDDYVTIMWENIRPGFEDDFRVYAKMIVTDFGIPYDYDSIMHYDEKAGSKNDKPTIVPKKSGVRIGLMKGLSKGDIKKLRIMYNCPAK